MDAAPKLIDIKEFGRLLDRSPRSLARDEDLGRVPRPLRLGRSKRWNRAEVLAWIEAGCPPRGRWEGRRRTSGAA